MSKIQTYRRYAPSLPPRPGTLTTRYQQGGYYLTVDAVNVKQAYALLYGMQWALTATGVGIRSIKELSTGRIKEWNRRS